MLIEMSDTQLQAIVDLTEARIFKISSSGLGDLENPRLHEQSKGFKSLSAVCNKRKAV